MLLYLLNTLPLGILEKFKLCYNQKKEEITSPTTDVSASISANALLNSEEAPTKLLSLSDFRSPMFPLRLTNLRKHKINDAVFSEVTVSMWVALLDNYVNKAP